MIERADILEDGAESQRDEGNTNQKASYSTYAI